MPNNKQTPSPEEQFVIGMLDIIQHCQVLGMEMVRAERGKVTLCIPYRQEFVGNPETGVIHGGTLTTLMDTACGAASMLSLDTIQICPTLDLRIDYMTTAEPGKPIYGTAESYRVARQVIFTRGIAHHENAEHTPIAHCVATFMRLDTFTLAQ